LFFVVVLLVVEDTIPNIEVIIVDVEWVGQVAVVVVVGTAAVIAILIVITVLVMVCLCHHLHRDGLVVWIHEPCDRIRI